MTGGIERLAHHHGQRLAGKGDLIGGEQRLVLADRRDVVLPGMSLGPSTATTPGADATAARSRLRKRPAATGLRISAPCSVPAGSGMSSI
jgi:hypothetical protein